MLLLVSIRIGQAQRQIGFSREFDDGLRLLAFENLEIVLGQIGDEAAFLVRDRVEHVDARDVQRDAALIAGIGRRGLVVVLGLIFGLAGEQERQSAENDDGVQLLHERCNHYRMRARREHRLTHEGLVRAVKCGTCLRIGTAAKRSHFKGEVEVNKFFLFKRPPGLPLLCSCS